MKRSAKIFFGGMLVAGILVTVLSALLGDRLAVFSALCGVGLALLNGAATWGVLSRILNSSAGGMVAILTLAWTIKLGIMFLLLVLMSKSGMVSGVWFAAGVGVLLVGGLGLAVVEMPRYAR